MNTLRFMAGEILPTMHPVDWTVLIIGLAIIVGGMTLDARRRS